MGPPAKGTASLASRSSLLLHRTGLATQPLGMGPGESCPIRRVDVWAGQATDRVRRVRPNPCSAIERWANGWAAFRLSVSDGSRAQLHYAPGPFRQGSMGHNLIIFASSAIVPVASMPAVVRWLADINLTSQIDATRAMGRTTPLSSNEEHPAPRAQRSVDRTRVKHPVSAVDRS
jgi:hypothetical protein